MMKVPVGFCCALILSAVIPWGIESVCAQEDPPSENVPAAKESIPSLVGEEESPAEEIAPPETE